MMGGRVVTRVVTIAYLKHIPGKHVDPFKDKVKDWLDVTLCALWPEGRVAQSPEGACDPNRPR